MRIVIIAFFIISLFSVSANARKQRRQVSFDFGFPSNQQPTNIGQFLGGLFGQGGNKSPKKPLSGLFDVLSGVATQFGINKSSNNNQGQNNQNLFPSFNIELLGSQASGCSFNNGGCEHGCREINGRRQCYCHEGYHLHVHDGSCGDTNECVEYQPCQDRCENTLGSYRCFCSRGTLQPNGSCKVDGFVITGGNSGSNFRQNCRNNNGGCEQICKQRRNKVRCSCEPGFSPDPGNPNSCQDVDECKIGLNDCHNRCINSIGSYSCQGFSFPNNPVSTCGNNNGGCHHRCKDTENGVKCKCRRSFILQPDGKSCGCPPGSMKAGNQCLGFSASSNRRINCDIDNGGCQQQCDKPKQTRRGRRGKHTCRCNLTHFELKNDKRSCDCKRGFTLSVTGRRCLDAKEEALEIKSCDINNGGCQYQCQSLEIIGNRCICPLRSKLQEDKRSCKCNKGHSFSPDGLECIEKRSEPQVDLCAINNGGCQHNCKLTARSFECSCNTLLHHLGPDGKSCILQDPCLSNNGGCDHICSNNKGLASCSCQPGWILQSNGVNCKEIPPVTQRPTTTTTQRSKSGCGVNNKKDLLRRIVGGKPADPKDWPWMAAILRKQNEDQFCGAVLITDRHALTASHCLVDFKKEDILVRLGEYDFSTTTENNPTDFAVIDIRLHEMYNRSSQENDIALMRLDRPSAFSEFIWPVCLPPNPQEFTNQLGYVTGWGTTSFGGKVSRVLQEVIVPVWAQSECEAAYPNKVVKTMMCAGLKEGGKDSCQGDSGGPYLVQIYPSSRWFVIGVVSWGIKCAEAGNPGVYTRVADYLPWIKANAVF